MSKGDGPPEAGGTEMDTTTLWVNDNGRIVCAEHGGGYLTRAIGAKPRARSHWTPGRR